jgi:hypothetical protein
MSNTVVVREYHGAWLVCIPGLPSNACWSSHEALSEAEAEAASLVEDMGYDRYVVQL